MGEVQPPAIVLLATHTVTTRLSRGVSLATFGPARPHAFDVIELTQDHLEPQKTIRDPLNPDLKPP